MSVLRLARIGAQASLVVLAFAASACHQEACEKGKKLQENLGQLEFSLRGALSEPGRLGELCAWIKDNEDPYLRLSALELVSIAQKPRSALCLTDGASEPCKVELEVRDTARDLSAALVNDFGIARNIEGMCGSYYVKGYTTDIQFYIRDTINQLRNPVSQASARKFMAHAGCGEP